MKFSERIGQGEPSPAEPIIDSAPSTLRNAFFRVVLDGLTYVDDDSRYSNPGRLPLGIKALIRELCSETDDELHDEDTDSWHCRDSLKARVLDLDWYQFYDFVEMVGRMLRMAEQQYASDIPWDEPGMDQFGFPAYRRAVNSLFAEKRVAWRLNPDGHFERAFPEELANQLDETEQRLADRYEPARDHYRKARRYVLNQPLDVENSIKESISAVESICRILFPGSSTLGDAVRIMRKEGDVPPGLVTIIEKFYAYACAEPAVRHGGAAKSSVLILDAEFALLLGAAIIRYLMARHDSDNIQDGIQ